MENLALQMVQGQTGYTFKNPALLRQAFTRRSYSEEHGGENNEVLEFIGDKALDLAVVKHLIRIYGKMKADGSAAPAGSGANGMPVGMNEFVCSQNEGELTKIKSRMVGKNYLAKRIDELGFAQFIIMGEGDRKNKVENAPSVKEDLFEAIIGAVALDCGWNLEEISSVVEAMLCLNDFFLSDTDDNYVQLIQEWEEKVNHTIPLFWFHTWHGVETYGMIVPTESGAVFQKLPSRTIGRLKHLCDLKLLDSLPVFRGWGESKSEARMNVCKLAYEYLLREGYIKKTDIRDEIDGPSKEFAINQLEILARRGYFPLPKYDFSQDYDEDGNPVWQCQCRLEGFQTQHSEKSSSKKDAKKSAALKMLLYVLKCRE